MPFLFNNIKVRTQLCLTSSLLLTMRMIAQETAFHLQGAIIIDAIKFHVQARLYCTISTITPTKLTHPLHPTKPSHDYNESFHCTLQQCSCYSASQWLANKNISSSVNLWQLMFFHPQSLLSYMAIYTAPHLRCDVLPHQPTKQASLQRSLLQGRPQLRLSSHTTLHFTCTAL